MITDWEQLARLIGSLHEDGSESGRESLSQQALEEILGDEWIKNTVEHIIDLKPGGELAMNCLCYLHSAKAANYAYYIYKNSSGERVGQAVWLIKHLANPISLDWVEVFLKDKTVIQLGLGVLDQLLWTQQIPYDHRAKSLLELAGKISNGQLKDQIDFIQQYSEDRNSR
ncbi:MAG: hypothetical protein KA821_02745 [Chitinophagaceae bacterium]|nr:hypothetical protein [Chitinophagaceae bacterium]